MEQYRVTKKGSSLHIQGFPDAAKLVKLQGPRAQQLSHLMLHRSDLDFALEGLAAINDTAQEPSVLRQALWRSAVIHFIKCFGQSRSRFSLNYKKIYKGDSGALTAFEFFKSLRNKHFIHDENPYTQGLPNAVLNKKGMPNKIATIVCMDISGESLSQESYGNLYLLATRAHAWVVERYEKLCAQLTTELEAMPYEELLALDAPSFAVPEAQDVHINRSGL